MRSGARPCRRGFTLVELAMVTSLTGLLAGAAGLAYLEIRAAGLQAEARVGMERRAALALEWVARDLRGARAVDGATVERPDGPVRYEVQEGLLRRIAPRSVRTLARHADSLSIEAVPGGHRARLRLDRRFYRERHIVLDREVFVGVRR